MVFMDELFIERLLSFILAILLFYSAFKLLNTLKNKEIAISMVFLHKKRAINLFGLLVIAALFTFLTGIIFVIFGGGLLAEIILNLNALTLFIFTFLLERLMGGG